MYLEATKGGKVALDFLKDMEPELSQRDEQFWLDLHIAEYQDNGTLNKIKMNLNSIPQSVFGNIISGTEDIVSIITTGDINPYSGSHGIQNMASTTRELTAGEIDKNIDSDFLSGLAKFAYQGVMSSADMVLGGKTLGESGYMISMGLGAFSSQARSLYERGESTWKIALGATAAATIEMASEKIGIEAFMKTLGSKTGKEWIKNLLIQFGAEPSEELVSKIGNLVADNWFMGQNSEMQNKIREYINQGMSETEARNKANAEFAKETAWEMYSALVSVGGTGIATGSLQGIKKAQTQRAINQVANGIVDNSNADVLLDLSKILPTDSKSYKLAENFTEADKNSSSKVAKLYSNLITDINSQIEGKTKTSINARLTELGGVEDVGKISDIIYRMAKMEDVENSEKRKVLKNASANTVYTELTSEKAKITEWIQNLANVTQQLSEIRNVVSISGEVDNQTLNSVVNQLQISSNSQKPILQSSAESEESMPVDTAPELTETEQQILNTPDEQLNPEQQTIKQDLIARQQAASSTPSGAVKLTEEEKSGARNRVLSVAKKLDKDLKVVYVPRNSQELNGKKGKYVHDTKTMYLAEDLETKEAYIEVFKHEFIHRLELRRDYIAFKNFLFNKSVAFGEYAQSRLRLLDEQNGGETVKRTREQAIQELTQMYLDNFKNDSTIEQSVRDNFTKEKGE
jgi:hypothetical protein